ncbi:BON domain-containing protein [Pseudidiomarina sediminum]|uniref:BON domain-containing protein n=1 Tax=Pseudidiomarina sediminum TaxID=431675 RepID=A0A432Z481_9GAMM|nr:BON domain-containing protein [Pseudidiomarina sediminum]MBY6062912.1 BON domain-containing protein [Pseudidiomarina sediminum]RUO72712.1 BON domain-containing protein [Pseudidiomarina sediminum]
MKLSSVFTSVVSVMTLTFGTVAMAATLQDPAQQGMQFEQEQAGDHLSDSAITANVKSALMAQASGMQINVETTDGVVTLSGSVETEADSSALERIVRNVEGVKDVRNALEATSE